MNARIGINTGEVVAGSGERLVTGDAVNVAARLQQSAEAGEILFGALTLELVKGAVESEALTPLVLKGKEHPVAAYRLLRVLATPERRHESRFVGRERELDVLRQAWERVGREGRCELITVVADAGIGKSRLVAEFLASIHTRVLQGRCRSYGEGITYWPVVEVLKQLAAEPDVETAQVAIRSLLGESAPTVTTDEIAWAVRRTFELSARQEPLVVVFDDIQWGEDTFLDLVEHVALMSSGAAILLLCMARPELVERRPGWPVAMRLPPLSGDLIADLMPPEMDEGLRQRIARAAGGNPFFVSEMVAISSGAEEGGVVVPATLKALLGARLDQLEPDERTVLERGAVEGEVFHRGEIEALGAEQPVLPRLAALVRKEIVRPEQAQLLGEDGFRFRHLLIRDAAYATLSKRDRAELHERFATWLADRGRDLVELDEVLGYHLEQAWRYSSELGIANPELQASALRHVRAAEERAMHREDYRAARKLVERALALVSAGEVDPMLEIDRLDCRGMLGDLAGGFEAIASARERAARAGLREVELPLLIEEMYWRTVSSKGAELDTLQGTIDKVLPELEAAGHDLGLYMAYLTAGDIAINRGRADQARLLLQKALLHAESLPPHNVGFVRRYLGVALDEGSATSSEYIAWVDAWNSRRGVSKQSIRRYRAMARLGRTAEARLLAAQLREELRDRGNLNDLARSSVHLAEIERMAGRPEVAEAVLAEGVEILERQGAQSYLAELVAHHALALIEMGRFEEATKQVDRTKALADPTDLPTQALWRRAQARVQAASGGRGEPVDIAQQAVEIADRTDDLNAQAEARRDLAEVHALAGRPMAAIAAYDQALSLFKLKGNLVMTGRVRERLEQLRAAPALERSAPADPQ